MVFKEIASRIAILLVAFSGYAVGNILANVAADEVRSGKIYFKFLRNIMALSVIFFLAFFAKYFIYTLIPAALLLLLLIFSFHKTNKAKESAMAIALLVAIVTTFFSNNNNLIFLISALTFIYLLASVALLRRVEGKGEKKL